MLSEEDGTGNVVRGKFEYDPDFDPAENETVSDFIRREQERIRNFWDPSRRKISRPTRSKLLEASLSEHVDRILARSLGDAGKAEFENEFIPEMMSLPFINDEDSHAYVMEMGAKAIIETYSETDEYDIKDIRTPFENVLLLISDGLISETLYWEDEIDKDKLYGYLEVVLNAFPPKRCPDIARLYLYMALNGSDEAISAFEKAGLMFVYIGEKLFEDKFGGKPGTVDIEFRHTTAEPEEMAKIVPFTPRRDSNESARGKGFRMLAEEETFTGRGTVELTPDDMEDLRDVPELAGKTFKFKVDYVARFGDTIDPSDMILEKVTMEKDIDRMGGLLFRGDNETALEWYINGGVEDAVLNNWLGVEWIEYAEKTDESVAHAKKSPVRTGSNRRRI